MANFSIEPSVHNITSINNSYIKGGAHYTFIAQYDAIKWEQFLRRFRLDNFNKACRVEDSTLDQIYKKQICSERSKNICFPYIKSKILS